MRIAALACLAALALAGCTADDGPATTPPPTDEAPSALDRLREAMAGVPCDVPPPAGNENTANLKLLATIQIPAEADGIHAELDIRGDLAVHARYGSGGFEIYDISDPLRPLHLGNFTEADGALDVKFGPDNTTVFVGTGAGITMVDLRDPFNPVKSGEWRFTDAQVATDPLPRVGENAHMFYAKRIAGKDWLFLAPNSNTGAWVLEIGGTPEARTLTYRAQTLPVQGGPLGPHDIYVQQDALDGSWYLYSADGFHGWTAFNVDDPASPQPAGGFVNPAEGAYTHTLQAAAVNGKRIVATIAEIGADFLRLYDATNLAAPVLVGVWQADTTPQGASSPQHNLNIANGSLYISYYGHGMYVFDLAAATAGPSLPLAGSATLAPSAHWSVLGENVDQGFTGYWDTLVKDGVVYVSHIEGGLLVLGYGCNAPGDPAATSDG
ncbi:MAG: hypothetical protein QOD77_515 [Thermoplasmata archaeon]|jgi:hypothetical protein|nr:hypothetical protein [Thermoplasmata archaeon]